MPIPSGLSPRRTVIRRIRDFLSPSRYRVVTPASPFTSQPSQPIVIDYPIQTEAAHPDFSNVYVVSSGKLSNTQGQVLAKWSMTTGQETARIDLHAYANQISTQVCLALHPTDSSKLYAVLDQVNSPTNPPTGKPQYQLILIEVNTTTFTVTRTLEFGAFPISTPTGSMTEQPQKVRGFYLSSDGNQAYTIGIYPKIADVGTEGSIFWSDLLNWNHNGQGFIQDIVDSSGVRAAENAEQWKFLNTKITGIPGSSHALLTGQDEAQNTGILEVSLGGNAVIPIQTLSNLFGYTPIGWISDSLYVVALGNIQSIDKSMLNDPNAVPTHHTVVPTVEYDEPNGNHRRYQYTWGSHVIAEQAKKIICGGRDGVFIYDANTNSNTLDDSMISHSDPKYYVMRVLSGNQSGKVLLRIQEGWSGPVKNRFVEYAY